MLHYLKLERLARDNHSSLMDPFVSYDVVDTTPVALTWGRSIISCCGFKRAAYFVTIVSYSHKLFITLVSVCKIMTGKNHFVYTFFLGGGGLVGGIELNSFFEIYFSRCQKWDSNPRS